MVIDPNCDLKLTARRMIWGKVANSGQVHVLVTSPLMGTYNAQTCVAPDYALVPKKIVDQFVRECKEV